MDTNIFKEAFESPKMDFVLSHAIYCRDVLKLKKGQRAVISNGRVRWSTDSKREFPHVRKKQIWAAESGWGSDTGVSACFRSQQSLGSLPVWFIHTSVTFSFHCVQLVVGIWYEFRSLNNKSCFHARSELSPGVEGDDKFARLCCFSLLSKMLLYFALTKVPWSLLPSVFIIVYLKWGKWCYYRISLQIMKPCCVQHWVFFCHLFLVRNKPMQLPVAAGYFNGLKISGVEFFCSIFLISRITRLV